MLSIYLCLLYVVCWCSQLTVCCSSCWWWHDKFTAALVSCAFGSNWNQPTRYKHCGSLKYGTENTQPHGKMLQLICVWNYRVTCSVLHKFWIFVWCALSNSFTSTFANQNALQLMSCTLKVCIPLFQCWLWWLCLAVNGAILKRSHHLPTPFGTVSAFVYCGNGTLSFINEFLEFLCVALKTDCIVEHCGIHNCCLVFSLRTFYWSLLKMLKTFMGIICSTLRSSHIWSLMILKRQYLPQN